MDTNVVQDTVQNTIPGVLPEGAEPVVSDAGVSVAAPSTDGVLPTVEVGNVTPVEPIPVVESALEDTPAEPVVLPTADAGIPVEVNANPTDVAALPTDAVQPAPEPASPEPVVLPTEVSEPAAPAPAEPLGPTVEVKNQSPAEGTTNEDNFISVVDENGKEFKAEVVDIFTVTGYEGNNYIIYSFGEKIDENTDKVYVSKIEELADGTINLNAIVDNTEWDAVNRAINEKINADGGA